MYHSWMSLNGFFCPVLNRNSKSDSYESFLIFLPAIKQIIIKANKYLYILPCRDVFAGRGFLCGIYMRAFKMPRRPQQRERQNIAIF